MSRFNTLVAGIVVVTLVAVAGIVTVALTSTQQTAPTVTTIIGFCATITASMLALLRSELNAREIRSARDAVANKLDQTNTAVREIERRVNGNLEAAIDRAVQAERDQLINSTAMPRNGEELEALLERAISTALTRSTLKGGNELTPSGTAECLETDRSGCTGPSGHRTHGHR
jgi:hypothetical protein